MIEEYTLKKLCEKYNVNSEKIVNKNNNILNYGEYIEIDRTLNYLINELKISPKNIEKCPSILYRNVFAIKDNISFLRKTNIHFSNIESCLHVLSVEQKQLEDTYEYVVNNYGSSAINKNTSILSVDINTIIEVEKINLFISKEGYLTVAVAIKWGSTSLEEIQKMIQSKEFKNHPELFTSTTLAHAKIKDIQEMIQSEEFKRYPQLFTSQTLAHAKIKDIQEMIQSEEFKKYPELFTSTTLAHSKIKDIQEMIQSEEFKKYPQLFTSQTLAHATLEEIQNLLQLEYWKDNRFKDLLTSSITAKAKSMISKLPILIQIAEIYNIDRYLNTSYLLFSPSQNYALIMYLNENNLPLIIDEKLNPIFGKQPGFLKKKYGIDIKELIVKYPLNVDQIMNNNGGKKI